MKNFLVGIGTGITGFLDIFKRFNFSEDDKKIRETLEESTNNLTKLNADFVESAQQFANDPDINSANQVAQDIGAIEGGGGGSTVIPSNFNRVQEGEIKKSIEKGLDENADVGGETGVPADVDGQNIMPSAASEISDEEARRIIEEEDAADNVEGVGTETDEEELVLTDDDVGGADNVEGVNENDPMSVTPSTPSSPGSTSTAIPTGSSVDMEPEPEEGYTNIDGMFNPVGSSNNSSSVTPIKKSTYNVNRNRRRKQIVIPVNNENGSTVAPSLGGGGTKTKTIFVGQTSEKTLLDLQSLNNKHN